MSSPNIAAFSLEEPNQPNVSAIPSQITPKRTLHFQKKWYDEFPWLHYDSSLQKVLCFYCLKANAMGIIDLARCKEPAFIAHGFNNWKKAIEKFKSHQKSQTHSLAVRQIAAVKKPSVSAQLVTQMQKDQQLARNSLIKLFTSIRYLLRQGTAFRGHDKSDGNYLQLLKLRTEDDPNLEIYLKRTTNFTSFAGQNEMIRLFSHNILQDIIREIQRNEFFAVIVDGTQDIIGDEQESICLRHVDSELNVHEDFMGLYEIPSTTSDVLAQMIFDVLIRFGLSVDKLRAQTYDGAANMSGCHTGCQARVREKQPLALYFHCGSHTSNLVMQHAVNSCELIRDSLQWINELGALMSRSGKYKAIFQIICNSCESVESDNNLHPTKIKPLCVTRWLCRLDAIHSAICQYATILESLKEMSKATGESATKANGLHDRFMQGKIFLGLFMAVKPIAVLEQLNSALQAKSSNLSGAIEAVKKSSEHISTLRSDEAFHQVFVAAEKKCEDYYLNPIQLPRIRAPPRRYTDEASPYQPRTPEEFYRMQYFQFIDAITTGLSERYDTQQSGLAEYLKLEKMLTTGVVDHDVVAKYPEIDECTFPVQLQMFKQTYKAESLHDAKVAYRGADPTVRSLFPQVFILLKLLLVCPVTSCECERSFSALRRLKTWLRTTMSQRRLNDISVCHVHQDRLDNVDVRQLAERFAEMSEVRRKIFGAF